MQKIAIIAAQAENRIIGNGAEIPWRAKGEQALFKRITTGGCLIMGRKTFDTIGRSLPGRKTIVVSRDATLRIEGCRTVTSFSEAIEAARLTDRPIFIAGGGEIYNQSINTADVIHLTTIHTLVTGDVVFPIFNLAEFELIEEKFYESNINYTYRCYRRTSTGNQE